MDIGANIGNHSIFFSREMNANKVYAFEPVKTTFDVLKENIELNGIENVELFNIALGSETGMGSVNVVKKGSCGSNQIVADGIGIVIIQSLDSLDIEEKIDFVKIDVEGFEHDVILGAKEFLDKNSPVIFMEIFEKNFEKVVKLMKDYGYCIDKTLEDNNYIFKKSNE